MLKGDAAATSYGNCLGGEVSEELNPIGGRSMK